MPTPATMKQTRKLLSLFGDEPTVEQVQNLLGNGDLIQRMLDADLSQVDRGAFATLLTPAAPDIPWTPVSQYVERIMARSRLRGWGFTKKQSAALAANLTDHAGRLRPTGVTIRLGKGLEHDRAEAIAWLEDEAKACGFAFEDYTGPGRTSFYVGSEQSEQEDTKCLGPVGLDLETYWDPTDGVVPSEVRRLQRFWPGLEVAWLLALNPQVYVKMDGTIIPFMLASGLVVGSGSLPRFLRDGRKAFVGGYWDGRRWHGTAMVAFREL